MSSNGKGILGVIRGVREENMGRGKGYREWMIADARLGSDKLEFGTLLLHHHQW